MGEQKLVTRTYKSIHEFEKFINETPLNDVFRWEELSSTRTDIKEWSGTRDFDEAKDLMKHGADDLSEKINNMFKVKVKEMEQTTVRRAQYDVAGFQCSVPRYLQGVPTSMINQKNVSKKQKVVTLNKDMSYSRSWSSEEIIEESAKSLAIIKKVEQMGYRVNLNMCFVSKTGKQKAGLKIRVKNANERLNVSKMAFVMAHPSMIRRMIFRWIEVNPDITDNSYRGTYGAPDDVMLLQTDNEYTLPKEIKNIDEIIKKLKI